MAGDCAIKHVEVALSNAQGQKRSGQRMEAQHAKGYQKRQEPATLIPAVGLIGTASNQNIILAVVLDCFNRDFT